MRQTHSLYTCDACGSSQPASISGRVPSLPAGWGIVAGKGDMCPDCWPSQGGPKYVGLKRLAKALPLEAAVERILGLARYFFDEEGYRIVQALMNTLIEHRHSSSDAIIKALSDRFAQVADTGCYDDRCRWRASK